MWIEFIAKYWLEFIFGLAALCITNIIKKYYKIKDEKDEEDRKLRDLKLEKDITEKIEEEIQREVKHSEEVDDKTAQKIEIIQGELNNLTTGLLSVQGKEFRLECRNLLAEDHKISIDEYEQCEEDYNAYKALGGNHRGDALHSSVVEKFNAQISE